MRSFSSDSASKTVVQAGSMMNSKNTMCTGNRISGQPSNTGNAESPAIGMWTEKM
jgi:hypothetical protein